MKRKRRAAVHATSADVNLSQDLILDILTRLPTAAISRFKWVCMDWRRRFLWSSATAQSSPSSSNSEIWSPASCASPTTAACGKTSAPAPCLTRANETLHISCFPHQYQLLNLCSGMALSRIQACLRRCSIFQFHDPHLELDARPHDPNREYVVIKAPPWVWSLTSSHSIPAALPATSSSLRSPGACLKRNRRHRSSTLLERIGGGGWRSRRRRPRVSKPTGSWLRAPINSTEGLTELPNSATQGWWAS